MRAKEWLGKLVLTICGWFFMTLVVILWLSYRTPMGVCLSLMA